MLLIFFTYYAWKPIKLHNLVSYKATTDLVVVTISDSCNNLGNITIWLVILPIMGNYSYYQNLVKCISVPFRVWVWLTGLVMVIKPIILYSYHIVMTDVYICILSLLCILWTTKLFTNVILHCLYTSAYLENSPALLKIRTLDLSIHCPTLYPRHQRMLLTALNDWACCLYKERISVMPFVDLCFI